MKERPVIQSSVRVLILLSCIFSAAPVWAQSRPLLTEDAETVPSGNILFEAGVDFADNAQYPASGLTGNLWRIGTFGFSFGVSPIAEIQFDGGLRNRLTIEEIAPAPLNAMLELDGDVTGDVEDLTIGAKVRFVSETPSRPSVAVRFWTKLPNASNESGLGLDTTDFHFGLAVAKTVQSVRFVGNVGLGILADPTRGDRQNDVLDFGFSLARAVATGAELVGEINGRVSTAAGTPPVGTDSSATLRMGARFTRGAVRVDGALTIGVAELDPVWGFTGGMTWVFQAFTVQ
jgi:hypothetical protein